ncbi:MAG TPA: ATP-binding protein [Methylomirabilota bacterium]|jgi:two-component system sensor histidine kinase QseC|nr:ATP-binding protein [Methylomirabilota bacterium]
MRSLRARLFVYLLGGTAAALLVAGFALRTVVADALQREYDRALLARAQGLIALTEQEADQIEFEFEREHMPEFGAGSSPEYFELWMADGSLLQRSPSFDASEETRQAGLARSLEPAPMPRFGDVRLPDGRRGRQVQVDFIPPLDVEEDPAEAKDAPAPAPTASGTPTLTLLVAREREQFDAGIRRMELTVAGLGTGLIVALAALMQFGLRIGLRALDQMTGQVRALEVTSLDTRIAVRAPPEEIAVVVEQVNALLARVEAGFKRERRLSSDIAHELKTPITELRNLSEVGVRWPDDKAVVRQFFEDAGAIAQQMERVVVHLLALARYDEGREQIWTTPVHVAEVVDAAWKPLAREAAARGIEFRQEISRELRFETDAEKFALAVSNLLANAVAYSLPDTPVVCASEETRGRASVSFSNRAANLEPEDLGVMFDRFWRKDEARAGVHRVGLGLALVRALADLLGIEIETRLLLPDRTFRVTLSMPAGG